MGTVVLFPQDCLPISKSRQRRNFSDAFNGIRMPSDNSFQRFDPPIMYADTARNVCSAGNMVMELYPNQTRNNFCSYPLEREFEPRKSKAKRPGNLQAGDTHSAMLASNVAALQQSKVNISISDFNILKQSRQDSNGTGNKPCKTVNNALHERKKVRSALKNAFSDSKLTKVQGANSGLHFQGSTEGSLVDQVMQEANMVMGSTVRHRRSCDDSLSLSKELNRISAYEVSTVLRHVPLHASGNISPKVMFANRTSRVHELENVSTALRRVSTDPQLVEHLGHYRTQALQIPGSDVIAITRTSSLPPPERWAGPAYSASPAPSSLPLPKFSCLGQKAISLSVSSKVKHTRTAFPVPKELGSVSKTFVPLHAREKLDVAFATMSLRRMLKLDPS